MTLSRADLEQGFRLYLDLAEADLDLARELDFSRLEYFSEGEPSDADAALAERRHQEWFLFERPSESQGGVPAETLAERAPEVAPHAGVFLNSLAGVFEVTSVDPERGVWLRDLFGLGEYPLDEPEAASAFVPGDLVVGRLFPVGDALFRLSPAAAVFRNPVLLVALRDDAERLRAGRRGSLRIAQPELERMFFAPGSSETVDPVWLRETARAELVEGGADPALVDELFDALQEAARAGRAESVTEALNRLAFDTPIDLDAARARLIELWGAWRSTSLLGQRAARPKAPGRARDTVAPRDAVAQALAKFDEGREAGGNLEELFRALEDDLGLDPVPDGDDAEEAPDFPGVVGAVIEEFLWEIGREQGEAVARRHASLRKLGEYATSVGVIDNLTERHLLEFAARWVLDRQALPDAEAARDLVTALGAFCRWCEETQDLPLLGGFGPALEGLERSLPRLVELRQRHGGRPLQDGDVFTFARTRDGQPLLVDRQGEPHEVQLEEGLELLREGDVVQARIGPDGSTAVGACYPPELLALVA